MNVTLRVLGSVPNAQQLAHFNFINQFNSTANYIVFDSLKYK